MSAAARARRTIESLGRRSGPVFVNLAPGDLASYFYIALAQQLPPSADSIEADDDRQSDVRPRGDLTRRLQGGRRARTAGRPRRDARAAPDGRNVRDRPARASRSSSSKTLGSASLPIPRGAIPKLLRQIRRGTMPPGVAENGLPFVVPDVPRRRARRQRQGHPLQDRDQVSRRILVVDDEQGIRAALGQLLEFEGYEVHTAGNAADGIADYEKWRPNLVFMDVKMAGMDGLEGLRRIKQIDPSASVVMISGHATIQTAVEATQLGAYDILEKPLDTDRILVLLRNALQPSRSAGRER